MVIRPLRIEMGLPHLQIEQRLPQVRIDPSAALADLGLKPVGQLAREQAAAGQRRALEAIAQTAREGDRLARIELPGDPIVELARLRGQRDAQLNVDLAPKHRVAVEVAPGQVSVQLIPGQVRISGRIHLVAGRYIDLRA